MKRVDLADVQDLIGLDRYDSVCEHFVPDMIAELRALRLVEKAARELRDDKRYTSVWVALNDALVALEEK